MKNLLNRLFRALATMTAPKTMTPEEYAQKHASSGSDRVTFAPQNETLTKQESIMKSKQIMAERILEADEIKECVSNVFEQIMVKGYKAIPDILSEYPIEVVQSFVMTQKLALGEYAPEIDNLDAMPYDDMIALAQELNQFSFEKRMIEQGKAKTSAAQRDAINRIASARKIDIKVPENKFDASRLLDKLVNEMGNKPKVEMVNGITKKQHDKIAELSAKLGIIAVFPDNVESASKYIEQLMDTCTKTGISVVAMISAKQIEFIERLYKQLKKRMTKKQLENISKMTAKEASALIEELNAKVRELPEYNTISDSQANYIIELCNILMLPYNRADIVLMTREQASNKIAELQKEYLFKLYRATGTAISKEEVNAMSVESVRAMIKQIKEENKAHDYKNAEVR